MIPPWPSLDADQRAAVHDAMTHVAARDADPPLVSNAIIALGSNIER